MKKVLVIAVVVLSGCAQYPTPEQFRLGMSIEEAQQLYGKPMEQTVLESSEQNESIQYRCWLSSRNMAPETRHTLKVGARAPYLLDFQTNLPTSRLVKMQPDNDIINRKIIRDLK